MSAQIHIFFCSWQSTMKLFTNELLLCLVVFSFISNLFAVKLSAEEDSDFEDAVSQLDTDENGPKDNLVVTQSPDDKDKKKETPVDDVLKDVDKKTKKPKK